MSIETYQQGETDALPVPRAEIPFLPKGSARNWWNRLFFLTYIGDTYINLELAPPFLTDMFLPPVVFVAIKGAIVYKLSSLIGRRIGIQPDEMRTAVFLTWFFAMVLGTLAIAIPQDIKASGDFLIRLLRPDDLGNPLLCRFWNGLLPGTSGCSDGVGLSAIILSSAICAFLGLCLYLFLARYLKYGVFRGNWRKLWPWGVAFVTYVVINGFHAWFIRF